MIESGPIPAVHGVVRWRLADLMQWLWEEYRISKQTLSRELRALNFRSNYPGPCANRDSLIPCWYGPQRS